MKGTDVNIMLGVSTIIAIVILCITVVLFVAWLTTKLIIKHKDKKKGEKEK